MAEDAVVKPPRWRRWGKEALWLLLMALVISTLLDLWRGPTLPAGPWRPLHPAGWHHHQPGRTEPRQAAAGLLLGQLVWRMPLHYPHGGAALAAG